MHESILKLLSCPVCEGSLEIEKKHLSGGEIVDGSLVCENNHRWHIVNGVLDFNSKEQGFTNNWSDHEKDTGFQEMDKYIRENTPESLRKLNYDAAEKIVELLNIKRPSVIVDIATGRGMLLQELANSLKFETQIVAADLSHAILKYDRSKIGGSKGPVKISYIACDATNLPFKDNSICAVTSFFGLSNMLNLMVPGLKDIHRVLAAGHPIYDAELIIHENSNGYNTLMEFAASNNIVLDKQFATMEGLKNAYHGSGFDEADIVTIGEGIGEESTLDILPYKNEWYATVVACGIK